MKMQTTHQKNQANGSNPLSFCIVLYNDGRIERILDRPLEEYLAAIQDAGLAWIDYTTKEDDQEIENLSKLAGFSPDPDPETDHRFLLRVRRLRYRTGHHAPFGDRQGREDDRAPALCPHPGQFHPHNPLRGD